jgi:biopolymer transport protein ExbD
MRSTGPAVRFDVASEINVTPMIDVMLVLLIIFMVVTPAVVMAKLPRARTAAPERDRRITLVIQRDGAFTLDLGRTLEKVPARRLEPRLAELYAARPDDHVLYLKADREASYDRVLAAMDAARHAGVRRIGAITEQARPRHGR